MLSVETVDVLSVVLADVLVSLSVETADVLSVVTDVVSVETVVVELVLVGVVLGSTTVIEPLIGRTSFVISNPSSSVINILSRVTGITVPGTAFSPTL